MKKRACIMLSLTMLVIVFFAAGGVASASVIAWNDLGMHCMDTDYSVFALLPPFNNLHAQVIDNKTGTLISSDIDLRYRATSDTRGSINTSSYRKTNFWDWAPTLFGAGPEVDAGLTGNPVQSRTPAPLAYDAGAGFWRADGIPTVPYDDRKRQNFYPMVLVAAKSAKGKTLATTKTVLPVSDEMTCLACHASGGDPSAQPSGGWVNDPVPGKDWKRNILAIHDERNAGNPLYSSALTINGYNSRGLLATSDSGTPVLCANCHASNALAKPGITGVKQLTTAVHSWHATRAMDDETGMPLDQTTTRSACYYCHPGSTTQCLRGVMGKAKDANGDPLLQCQSCHGSMSVVGAEGRSGWIDLPSCQYCHYLSAATGGYVRDTSAFDTSGKFRQVTSIFSTGSTLYKLAAEHGNIQCEACHGSTHAEYPSAEANDNVQSILLQGHAGTISDCSVCHPKTMTVTNNGGPHGLHTTGTAWVKSHAVHATQSAQYCATCHGLDYQGTFLSKAATKRVLRTSANKKKTFSKAHIMSCFDCHTSAVWQAIK
ncbi:MAG TPA: hypothetical protein VK435_02720 [Thermodesulfovibrionales bacterium]|nr:hypothetical protein [Thermodesulfovibrionales bacterium]